MYGFGEHTVLRRKIARGLCATPPPPPQMLIFILTCAVLCKPRVGIWTKQAVLIGPVKIIFINKKITKNNLKLASYMSWCMLL